jgi:hypothetical protein
MREYAALGHHGRTPFGPPKRQVSLYGARLLASPKAGVGRSAAGCDAVLKEAPARHSGRPTSGLLGGT